MIQRGHNVNGADFILWRKLGISACHFQAGVPQERAYYLVRHAGLRKQASVCVTQAVERKAPLPVLYAVIKSRFCHGLFKGLARVVHDGSRGGRENKVITSAPLGPRPEHGRNLRRHVGGIAARLGFHHVNNACRKIDLPEAQRKDVSQAQPGMQADHSDVVPQWRNVAKDAEEVLRLLFCQVEQAFVVDLRELHAVRRARAGVHAPQGRLFEYPPNKPDGVDDRLLGQAFAQKGRLEFRHVKGGYGGKRHGAENREDMPGKGRQLSGLFERGQMYLLPFRERFRKGHFAAHAGAFPKTDFFKAFPAHLGGIGLCDALAAPPYLFPFLAAVFDIGYFKTYVRLAEVTALGRFADIHPGIFGQSSLGHFVLPFCYPTGGIMGENRAPYRKKGLHVFNIICNEFRGDRTKEAPMQQGATFCNDASQAEGCGFKSRFPLQISI